MANGDQVIGLAFADEGYELDVDWPDMRVKLKAFVDSPWVAESLDPALDRKWARLSNIVNPLLGQGLIGIDIFDAKFKTLQCRLGVENGAISGIEELHLPFFLFQCWTAKYSVLKRLVIRPGQPKSTKILFRLLAIYPGFCLADVPTQEHSLLSTIRTFCYLWLLCSRSFTFTFFEQDMNHLERVVAKMEIKPVPKNDGGGMEINMVEWMYSHVATAVDGLGTMILESTTRYSPTALASLRMDVSRLKDRGLARMKKVLKQSNLEQLFVECEAFNLSRSSLVGQVLGAVRWSNIVSLEISGSCINDFLQVWMLYGNPFEPFDPSSVESAFSGNKLELVKALLGQDERLEIVLRIYAKGSSPSSELTTFGLRLKSLTVRSTGHTHRPLSHVSVLFIHNLIYSSPLVDLSLENVHLQDNQDWDLVIDAIDFSELTVLGMFKSNFQDVQMLLEKLGEQRTPLEKLDLRYTPADEELRKKFRYN
ncbi:hypothetical protein MVEG_08348 [Podila verticillata NRRL 6337]|nr:hypothetical protein MVEG_08348 [Podila verticillata NRRL 6337]